MGKQLIKYTRIKKLVELNRRENLFLWMSAIGLGSVFLHLDAELNWYKIFNELMMTSLLNK